MSAPPESGTPAGQLPVGCFDEQFGPWAGPTCRGGFDFTLFFEETILRVPVQALFLYILPYRILQLVKMDKKVKPGVLRPIKLILSFVLMVFNIALLALWVNTDDDQITHTPATLPSAALVFASSVGLIVLTALEHGRTINPSFLITIYLLLTTLLDMAHVRTLFLIGDYRNIPALSLISILLRVLMVVMESMSKVDCILADREYSVEVTSSTISRTLFTWLLPLFRRGFGRNIFLKDLYPLDDNLTSRALYKSFSEQWEKAPNQKAAGAFMNTWFRAFAFPVLAPVIPRLFLIAFTYAQPLLIEQAVLFAATPQQQPFDNYGYGLIGAFALVYGGLAVSASQYAYRVRRTGARLRGSLNTMIFQKSLKLDLTSPNVTPTGALTLVGNDTETIVQGANQLHEIWAGLVEMAVGIYLIERQLGAAAAMPIGIGVFIIIITTIVSIPTGTSQAAWIQSSQDRVSATTKTLGSVKPLKISGLGDVAFTLIRKLRVRELAVSLRFRLLLGTTLILLILVPVWSPILTFAVYAGIANGGGLDFAQVFASYSLITLLNGPLSNMIVALPTLAGAITSFQRVQNHMNAKERQDNRVNPKNDNYPRFIPPMNYSDSDLTETMTLLGDDEVAEKHKSAEAGIKSVNKDLVASIRGHFTWPREEDPVIDINGWDIRRETLTFILGPVGCGKSTLIKALLGELTGFEGMVWTNYSGVSYCDQGAWVPNQTVRQIIIGPAEFEPKWYWQVIRACALEEDLRNWAQGDQTPAGTSGISLSGGQRQRLSLARAVYSRRELIILDDVFSGLDATTENWVFHSLLGRHGLLRQGKITVVSTSSKLTRIQYADNIVFLNEHGEIDAQGSPEELQKRLGLELARCEWDLELNNEANPPYEQKTENLLSAPEEMDKDDLSRRLGDNSMYIFYARAAGRSTLVILLAAMGLYAFCSSYPTIWLGEWAEEEDPLSQSPRFLGVYAALGIGAVISVGTGIYQILVRIVDRSGKFFHEQMVDTVSSAPLAYYASVDNGITVNRFSQDLRLVDMELPSASFGVATALAFSIAQFVLVAVSLPYMAALLPVLIGILWIIQFIYLRTSRQLRLLDIEHKSPLYSQLIETLEGLAVVRAHGWEGWFHQQNLDLVDNAQRPAYLLACLQVWLNFSTDMFIFFLAMAFIFLGTFLREQIGPRAIGVGLSNVLGFGNTLKTLVTFYVMLEIALGAVARIRQFTENTPVEGEGQNIQDPPEDHEWPTMGYVQLQDVVASYENSGPVLKGLSLSIMPGEKVAVCGRSGSGKSTLTLTLLKMMELDEGSITIDGINIRDLPHEYVRTKLVALPQQTYVFDGTARLNMDPSQEIPDDQIVEVLERVQLWPKIEARGGLDTVINDDFFSPGEKQLLVFARAMLRESRILILDEFTSSLDERASVIVDEVVKEWFQGWTIISIAHKLQSVIEYDKVAVLEHGELIEWDSPKVLLEQPGSVFRSLYEASAHT